MKELELKKPITAHGETLSVLEFDEPTGKKMSASWGIPTR